MIKESGTAIVTSIQELKYIPYVGAITPSSSSLTTAEDTILPITLEGRVIGANLINIIVWVGGGWGPQNGVFYSDPGATTILTETDALSNQAWTCREGFRPQRLLPLL